MFFIIIIIIIIIIILLTSINRTVLCFVFWLVEIATCFA